MDQFAAERYAQKLCIRYVSGPRNRWNHRIFEQGLTLNEYNLMQRGAACAPARATARSCWRLLAFRCEIAWVQMLTIVETSACRRSCRCALSVARAGLCLTVGLLKQHMSRRPFASVANAHQRMVLTEHPRNSLKPCGFGTPGRIRTCDLLLRRQTLYPSELQAHDEMSVSLAPFRVKPTWGGVVG
jgi:hypothetical protein